MMRADNSEDVSKGHTGSAIRNVVLATVPEKRLEVMLDIVRNKVARVLGTRPEKIEIDRSLMDLGLDSLMGFELRNWIEGELRLNVPVVELMQGPTVEKLTKLVLTQLEKGQKTDPKEKVASQLLLDPSTLLDTDPEKTKALGELMTMVGDVRGELQGSEDAIDLAVEASRYAAIFKEEFARDKSRNADPAREPKIIFMTGSTGFVGAYVLRHLLATDPRLQVRCLVRAESTQDGLARIHKNLDQFGQWDPNFAERIRPILGDVAQPQFGLSDGDYTQLSMDVDCVVHNAAGVNFLLTYTQLKPVNVEGTLNALRLAAAARVKPYFHVSTLFTFSILDHLQLATVTEQHNPARHELLLGGYLQSKWVADNIVQEARAAGLPATILRPGIVTGDSKTGASSNDIITRALASAIQLGCTPAEEMRFPFTPVDFVGKAIANLVLCGKASNRNFHLVNNDTVDWRTVIGWLVDRHFRIDILPYADWLERLKQSSTESAGTMLSALLPLIPEVQLSEHAEGFDRPIFDCGDSNAMLNTLGVGCPAITPELIDTYVAFLFQSGAISADCRPGG
jgi:thioester reductase-like protein